MISVYFFYIYSLMSQIFNLNSELYCQKKGAYAYYIKISSKVGLKILKTKQPIESISELKQTGAWKGAVKEFNLLKLLAKSKLCPEPKQLMVCYCVKTKTYLPGIQMEHIKGKPLSFHYYKAPEHLYVFKNKPYQASQLQIILQKAIESYGVVHRDLHYGNIIIEPSGSIRVIDLGLAHKKAVDTKC